MGAWAVQCPWPSAALLLTPAACSPSSSAFRREKQAGYNRHFCSVGFFFVLFCFSLSFALFIDLKAKTDH